MKPVELQEKTKEELEELLRQKEADLVKIKFGVAMRQRKNYKEISIVKKDIARIKTQLKLVNN